MQAGQTEQQQACWPARGQSSNNSIMSSMHKQSMNGPAGLLPLQVQAGPGPFDH